MPSSVRARARLERDDDAAAHAGLIHGELAQALQVVGRDARRRLGLDRAAHVARRRSPPRSRSPGASTTARMYALAVVRCRRQLVEDPVLERLAEELRARLRAAPRRARRVDDADVGEEELRRADHAPLRPLRVGRQEPAEQRVDEDLEVLADGRRRDAALARDRGVVDELGVRRAPRRRGSRRRRGRLRVRPSAATSSFR